MDEAGEQKSFKLEKVTINVKEMGIRSWLRGQG
jgi:predicted GNAT family acetyltransferase